MYTSSDRKECYWLLMQWRERSHRDLSVLPLGNVQRLNHCLGNLNALDAIMKKIHAGMRAMAAGAGLV